MGWYILGETYDFGTALSAVGIAGIVENQDLTRSNERNLQKGSKTTKLRLLFLLFKVFGVYFQCINLLNFWKKLTLKCSNISEAKLLLLRCYCRLHVNSSLVGRFQQNESISDIHPHPLSPPPPPPHQKKLHNHCFQFLPGILSSWEKFDRRGGLKQLLDPSAVFGSWPHTTRPRFWTIQNGRLKTDDTLRRR